VNVTGTVADIRPYLQHAAVVVAPLRVARGIQNKVLEAMAMEAAGSGVRGHVRRPSTPASVSSCSARRRPTDYVHRITGLLCDPQSAQAMGRAARLQVLRSYSWEAHLSAIDRRLGALNGVEVTA
jgi:hypothetical protein